MIDENSPDEESCELPDVQDHVISEQDLRKMTSYILAGERCTSCDNFLDGGHNCPHCGVNVPW